MAIKTTTTYKVVLGTVCVDAFTTDTFTDETARIKAIESRNRFNDSEYGQANDRPYRVVRAVKTRRINQL